MSQNADTTRAFIEKIWIAQVIPELEAYIRIPNQSPSFDDEWATNGLLEQAAEHVAKWARARQIPGLKVDIVTEKGRTPLVTIEVPSADSNRNVLMYGHFDKQPPLTEAWDAPLHPLEPVIRDGKLYGRGGADDGYSIYSALTAIEALATQGAKYPRCFVMIEGSEESGSFDLPYYIEKLAAEVGTPDLIVCLDSGAGNYEQMWLTTSLRGAMAVHLSVQVLEQAVHSGIGSGVVPDSFRIVRHLLERIEDSLTGKIKVPELFANIPPHRIAENEQAAAIIGKDIPTEYASTAGLQLIDFPDYAQMSLNRTWIPTMVVTGADGVPAVVNGGNIVRTFTKLKLAFRIPPTVDIDVAAEAVLKVLRADPPYNAKVTAEVAQRGPSWDSPALSPLLQQHLTEAGKAFFNNKPTISLGLGGSIPFMGMLAAQFPKAQFLVTGVLGPMANAHGPNEFLHLDYAKRLTCSIASVLNNVELKGL